MFLDDQTYLEVMQCRNGLTQTAIETDTSNYEITAVLLQIYNEAFISVQIASKTLTSAQKEAQAVMFDIERFREYLLGGKFEIITDHKLLLMLLERENAMSAMLVNCNVRLQRWSLLYD